jgi:hypothetical protein
MSGFVDLKFRLVTAVQHAVVNPLVRRSSSQILLESTRPGVRPTGADADRRRAASLLDEDDAQARLGTLPKANSAAVRALGTDLLTIRVDLTS